MDDLHNQLVNKEQRARDEVMAALQERDKSIHRANKCEKQLEKLMNAPKPITLNLADESLLSSRSTRMQNGLQEENDYLYG